MTSATVARVFREETSRQRRSVKEASLAQACLSVIVNAMRQLRSDAHFVTLLRAEGMHTAPGFLLDLVDLDTGREEPVRAPLEEAENLGESEYLIDRLKSDNLTAIQDYRLILRAIGHGLSKVEIAAVQGISIHQIRLKMRILRKISSEVATLFGDIRITLPTFDVLGKMTKTRQVEVANMMIATGNCSCKFATALLAATPQNDLVKPKKVSGITLEQMAEMERDMAVLQHDLQLVRGSYGSDMLSLAISSAYLKKLISNSEIVDYLGSNHPELLDGCRAIVASTSVEHR